MRKYQEMHNGGVYSWSPEQARTYFETRGITAEEIHTVRREKTIVDKALSAGELFTRKGFHDFSGIDLALLLYSDKSDDRAIRMGASSIYVALSRFYKPQRKTMRELDIPYIHLLRVETGNNTSNLHRLKGYEIIGNQLQKTKDIEVYPNVVASYEDWKDGVCLPLPEDVDLNIARLFGYLWAAGTLYETSDTRPSLCLGFFGKETLRQAIEHRVRPLAERVFNVPFRQHDSTPQEVELRGFETQFKGVIIGRASKAISSFLTTEHNFPLCDYKTKLPNIPWQKPEIIDGFLAGFIEIEGHTSKNGCMEIRGQGLELSDKIDAILKLGGYGPTRPFKSDRPYEEWRIHLNRKATARVLHNLGETLVRS